MVDADTEPFRRLTYLLTHLGKFMNFVNAYKLYMLIKLVPYQTDILVSIISEFTAIFLLVYYIIISGYFYSFLDLFSTDL